MNHPHFIEVVAPPVADRRIQSGCEWLEEEVVDYAIKNGGMGEYSIVVCGRVGTGGGVGGRESKRRAGISIRRAYAAIWCCEVTWWKGWVALLAGRWLAAAPLSSHGQNNENPK